MGALNLLMDFLIHITGIWMNFPKTDQLGKLARHMIRSMGDKLWHFEASPSSIFHGHSSCLYASFAVAQFDRR